MPTRNTAVLGEILNALGHHSRQPEAAFSRLEEHFKNQLLLVAGDVQSIDRQAQSLRLAISTFEASMVLDYIQEQALAQIHIETADEVINALFPDRFVEP